MRVGLSVLPVLPLTLLSLGCGPAKKAIDYLVQALAIQQKTLPADHPDVKSSEDWVAARKKKLGQ